ncbi:DDE-type integrase/transposase/recombinase [Pararhizobium antarcticum]|nr:DDE-type integrase/transposase/recombinase [Pararhizobium antarcticum]
MAIQKHSDFLKRENLPIALSASELGIPSGTGGPVAVQGYDFASGFRFSILNEMRAKIAPMQVVSYDEHDGLGGRFTVQNVVSSNITHLSHEQISLLEQQGRFIPQESFRLGKTVGSSTAMEPADEDIARRKLAFVVAALEANEWVLEVPSKSVIQRSAGKLAANIGCKTPGYRQVQGDIERYLEAPFDRLAALVPAKSSGNRIRKFSDRFEEVLRVAVEYAWRQQKGTWKNAKTHFASLLLFPENADVREEATNAKDDLIEPSDRTIQRRMRSVDHFTRDLLRKGPEAALRIHGVKIPQMLPTAPLDIVEMDYTQLDVVVFHEKYGFIYGRPGIAWFRGRMSGSILGYAVFFGKPNMETFLLGLNHAIYPKDMRKHPWLKWEMYGVPLVLVVDCDPHLISDAMHEVCQRLGIILRELRPAEPNTKGAMERFIRTANDGLFHNLPGSTQSNPSRRKEVDPEQEAAVPKLTMDELNGYIAAFVHEYNHSSHAGLGVLRTLKEVPAKLWERGIKDAHQRRPISPEVLAHASGDFHWVAINQGTFTIEKVRYYDAALAVLATDPQATPPAKSGDGRKPRTTVTKYKAWRSPTNIGKASVVVPELGRTVIAEAHGDDRRYARGLTLSQHRLAMAEFRKNEHRPVTNLAELEASLGKHLDNLKSIYEDRKSFGTAEKFASFYRGVSRRVSRSEVVDVVVSEAASAEDYNYAEPFAPNPFSRVQDDPQYRPADTPYGTLARDEDGRLVPGDALLGMVPHYEAPDIDIGPDTSDENLPTRAGAYEDPDSIEHLLGEQENQENDE